MIERGLEKDPTSVRVRQRIEQLRHERRLTLKALSDRLSDLERPLGVSTLSKMISGDRRVDVDDLVALALALDVSPNAIILPAEARPGTDVHLTPARLLDAEQAWSWATKGSPVDGVDVFVSYVDADKAWAAWIGAQMEGAGQQVRLQAAGSPAGEDTAAWIGRQAQNAARTVAVCSAAYLDSHWCAPEWGGVLTGTTVIPLRVADVALPPVLADLGWRDLHGLDEPAARHRLLEAVGLAAVARAAASAGFPGTPSSPSGASGTPSGTVPPPVRQPAAWNVPPRLATFVGRQDLLDRIAAELGSEAAVAVYGLGGVGKTHLALAYCYRHRHDYDLVWWVPAEEPQLIVESLTALAAQVGVAIVGYAEESARAALEELRTGGGGRFSRWLVVLDNADVASDDPMVDGLLGAAEAGGGHVLVTSRDPGWARLAAAVEVDVLPREDAVRLLRVRAGHVPEAQADGVAEAVGDLPVALEQAGAWLAESGTSASAYEELLRRRARDVLARGTAAGRVSVAATWTAALDADADPAAATLAHLWARLAPEPIPLDLLGAERAGLVPEPLATAARDPLVLGDTVTQVTRLGLVRLTAGAVVMHRLVQAVLRDHTAEGERGQLHTSVMRLLAAAVAATGDPYSPAHWPRYDQLYPHARAVDLIGGGDQCSRDAVMQLINYLHARGDDLNVDRLAREARDRWATTLGEDHPDTILVGGYVAYMLRAKGEHRAARKLGCDVRSRCRRVLGDDHPYTIKAGTCLGATLRAQADYPAARTLFEDAASRGRRILGEDHPDTMSAMANLAVVLRAQGDYPASGALCKDVLSLRRRVLGDDHPHTISTMANLAAALRLAGDHSAARALGEDVLSVRERVLGYDHPDTIHAAANLAVTLRAQGDRRAARAQFGGHVVRCGTSSATTTLIKPGFGRLSATWA